MPVGGASAAAPRCEPKAPGSKGQTRTGDGDIGSSMFEALGKIGLSYTGSTVESTEAATKEVGRSKDTQDDAKGWEQGLALQVG